MSREAIDALEQWHATTRALRDASPGTSEWVRLRMIAQEQRAAYESLVEDGRSATQDKAREEKPEHQPR
jgi:hypothetical protein